MNSLSIRKRIAIAFLGLVTLLFFQNCGTSFELQKNSNEMNLSSSTNLEIPGDIPLDPNAELSVYVRNTQVYQGQDLVFKIELNKISSVPVVVQLETITGTALAFVDFEPQLASVTIPAGELSANFTVSSLIFQIGVTEKIMSLKAKSVSVGAIAQATGVGVIKATQKLLGFTQIVSKFHNICAITTAGTVKCWGYNGYSVDGMPVGTLGDGTTIPSKIPVDVLGLTGIKQLATSGITVCALSETGAVKCWGLNNDGDYGNSTTVSSPVPVEVANLVGIKQIAVGYQHSCVLTADNKVKCWGSGSAAGLNQTDRVPREMLGLDGAKQIKIGNQYGCAITATDTVKCWGYFASYRSNGQSHGVHDIAGLSEVKQISVSGTAACAIVANGAVKCWYPNEFDENNIPLIDSDPPVVIAGLTGIKDIAVGDYHTCVVTDANTVKCWGANSYGALGVENLASSITPIDVPNVANIKSLAVGNYQTCAVTLGDTLKCWGDTGYLGNTTDVTLPIATNIVGLAGVDKVAGASRFGCAVNSVGGTVKCWGSNNFGELGNGKINGNTITPPGDVLNISGIKQITTGLGHACAITETDTVKCWGFGVQGQLGNGLGTNSPIPVNVTGLSGVKQISAGQNSTCALTADNTVKCWGWNNKGQLGIGSLLNALTPTEVPGLTGIKHIAHFGGFACAITAQDTLKCWGGNTFGFFGNDNAIPALNPVDVPGFTDVKQVEVGNTYSDQLHMCILQNSGMIKCLGNNYSGQLGNGTFISSSTLVNVPGIDGAKQLALGIDFSCALLANDSVKCWGLNKDGQLGNNTLKNSATPVEAIGLTSVKQIVAAGSSILAVRANGRVRKTGQVKYGANQPVDVSLPVQ
jgi:alpha-tubulin suppressor-like RCC1 family protein